MLDVHPPHEATHTWKDFFIHIATIVVGLLIAVGLEQVVEYFHHRNQAHEAREQTLAEIDLNRKHVDSELSRIELHERWLMQDLAIVTHLRARKLLPNDRLRYIRYADKFSTSAWTSAQSTGITNYLPREEVNAWEACYRLQTNIDEYSVAAKAALVEATSVVNSAEGPQHLTAAHYIEQEMSVNRDPESQAGKMENLTSVDLLRIKPQQLDELERGLQLALSQDDQMIRWYADLNLLLDKLPRS